MSHPAEVPIENPIECPIDPLTTFTSPSPSKFPKPQGQVVSSRHKPLQTKGAWDRLIRAAENLKALRSLGDAEARRVREAVEILKTAQTSLKRQKYKRFLCDVLSISGPQAVLVCAVAFGQVKVVDMKSCDRIGLICRIQKDHTNLDHPTLRTLAIGRHIPNSVNDLQPVQASKSNPQARQPVQQIGMCDQPAVENRATSHIQPRPRTRRHIEDEHAPEPVQMEGLVGGETARRGPETGGAENEELQRRQKEIEYWCSKAPISQMWLLGERLFEAIQSSNQWKLERDLGGSTTDCLNALLPKDWSQDISITLVVGREKGVELVNKFNLSLL